MAGTQYLQKYAPKAASSALSPAHKRLDVVLKRILCKMHSSLRKKPADAAAGSSLGWRYHADLLRGPGNQGGRGRRKGLPNPSNSVKICSRPLRGNSMRKSSSASVRSLPHEDFSQASVRFGQPALAWRNSAKTHKNRGNIAGTRLKSPASEPLRVESRRSVTRTRIARQLN